MARNMVQFQKGLSMVDFLNKFGSEEACREAVFTLRWPEGFRCPECGNSTYCDTAWLLKQKLMQTMRERDDSQPLSGSV